MVKFGKKVVKFRIPIIIISILLLIPAALGYINTRVNYDVEYYGAAGSSAIIRFPLASYSTVLLPATLCYIFRT